MVYSSKILTFFTTEENLSPFSCSPASSSCFCSQADWFSEDKRLAKFFEIASVALSELVRV